MADSPTNIPGMQGNEGKTHIKQGGTYPPGRSTPYSESDEKGTRVPSVNKEETENTQPIRKPLVGFLVSVSKTEEGEYWLLHQGQNEIGTGNNCSVRLMEASVSGIHATLSIHRNPGDKNRLNVGIIDRGSSNGVFVNDDYIGFNARECKNFDTIKIGNYELLIMLFDMVDHKLKKADEFTPLKTSEYQERSSFSPDDEGTRF